MGIRPTQSISTNGRRSCSLSYHAAHMTAEVSRLLRLCSQHIYLYTIDNLLQVIHIVIVLHMQPLR